MKEDNPNRIILRFCETACQDSHGKLEHSDFSRKFPIGGSGLKRSLCAILIAKNTEGIQYDRDMTLHIADLSGTEIFSEGVELFPNGIGEYAAQFVEITREFPVGRYTAELRRGAKVVQSDYWNFVPD